ncbi:MAG: hypothetical protein A2Z28_06500 [Chloroflexi bacterium RBG_16_51_9]|nr:MAG: hypothetical protein A2Z28_06500 [Chloroflexi bacterium RBG_16_51_9]
MNWFALGAMGPLIKSNLRVYFDLVNHGVDHKEALVMVLKSRYPFEPGKILTVQARWIGTRMAEAHFDRTKLPTAKDELRDLIHTMYSVETHAERAVGLTRLKENERFDDKFNKLYDSMKVKCEMNWFQRHLNWTWLFIYLIWIPLNDTGGKGLPAAVLYPVGSVFLLIGSIWVIKQKGRKLWWVLLTPFFSPFWLKSKGYRELTETKDPKTGFIQEARMGTGRFIQITGWVVWWFSPKRSYSIIKIPIGMVIVYLFIDSFILEFRQFIQAFRTEPIFTGMFLFLLPIFVIAFFAQTIVAGGIFYLPYYAFEEEHKGWKTLLKGIGILFVLYLLLKVTRGCTFA